MKRFLSAILLLAACVCAPAQTFDTQSAAALAAVQQLQAAAEAKVASDAQQIAALTSTNTSLAAQIETLRSTVTYSDLEWGAWSLNDSTKVGGSSNGTSSFTPADTNKPAVFSVAPAAVTTGTNYYDSYATQKKKPNAAYKNFYLAVQWDFPGDADMNAAHCIEMEMRQVFNSSAAIPALQMNFTGNQLRYFDANPNHRGWFATGIAMPRTRTITAVLEAHRDDTTVYYDAFTINGVRHPLVFTQPIVPLSWADRMSVSVQLDAKSLAFKVRPSAMVMKVW
jgi:hypothetical protein